MLVFNSSGLLVPDKKISSDIHQMEVEFVKNIASTKRNELFEQLLKYNDDLKTKCGISTLRQWINGSFVTKNLNPGDIDVVTLIDYDVLSKIGDKINSFKYPNSEKEYKVDAYIIEVYPLGHKNHIFTLSDLSYWENEFTRTRRNRIGNRLRKGFLEIYY